jgi:hypothetical protein
MAREKPGNRSEIFFFKAGLTAWGGVEYLYVRYCRPELNGSDLGESAGVLGKLKNRFDFSLGLQVNWAIAIGKRTGW